MNFSIKAAKLSIISLLVLPSLAMATCNNNMVATTATTTVLVDNNDGTISDSVTGLMWKKCSEGQVYNAGACSGTSANFNWSSSHTRAAAVNAGTAGEKRGYGDWRVPNIKELTSIIEYKCYSPSINDTIFPDVPTTGAPGYWSSTPRVGSSNTYYDQAMYVEFGVGGTAPYTKNNGKYLRLVRSQ